MVAQVSTGSAHVPSSLSVSSPPLTASFGGESSVLSICKNLINSPTKLNAAKAVNGPALQKENNKPPH